MSSPAQKAAPFPFLLVLIFFLLPFLEFSCKDQKIATLNGYQAAFGTELEGMKVMDQKVVSQRTEATPMLIAVLAIAAVGALLATLKINLLACFSAIAGVVLLFTLRSDVNNRMQKENAGLVAVHYKEGYYASIAALALAALMTGALGLFPKSKSNL